jgi:putative membrane protein
MIDGVADIHLDVLAGVGLAAGAWVGAWLARGARPRRGETLAFAGALVTLLVVLNGPLHALSDRYLFSAHMVQHLALSLVVPPLLLIGLPAWMIDALARPAWLARALTRPVPALGLYAIALVGWHLPRPYGAALETHGLHIVQHLSLIATAVLAWWPVLARSEAAPRLPHAAQILYLFAFGFPMTAVAVMITGAETLLYPFYEAAPRVLPLSALADQRLGGVIMWVPAGLVPLVAFTVVFFKWAAAERDVDDIAPVASRRPS